MTTSFNTSENSVACRNSITELCAAWSQSSAEIMQAFKLLAGARQRLREKFDGTGYRSSLDIREKHDRVPDYEKPQDTLKEMERQVWANVVARLELRKIMSLKRTAEMDKQIESGVGLPPLTVENVLAVLESNLNNSSQYLEEKVLECYENLRPCGYRLDDYKTNQKSAAAGVGTKVILTYAVRRSYRSDKGFEVQYGGTQDRLRALDQVFHLLDGKPVNSASWAGELCDAISNQTTRDKNSFETPYFKGRCFGNGNLHLEFKRGDLVGKFNLVAGGARLNHPQAN